MTTLLLKGEMDNTNDNAIFEALSHVWREVEAKKQLEPTDKSIVLLYKMLAFFDTDAQKIQLINKTSFNGFNLLHNKTTLASPLIFEKILSWLPSNRRLDILTNDALCEDFIKRYMMSYLDIRNGQIREDVTYSFSILYFQPERLEIIFSALATEADKRRFMRYMLAQPFPEHTYPEAGVENFDALAAGARNYSDSADFLKKQIWILCNIHPPLGSQYVASQTMLGYLPQALTRPFESLYSKVSNATTQAQLRELCLPKLDELILDDETEIHNMVQGINI